MSRDDDYHEELLRNGNAANSSSSLGRSNSSIDPIWFKRFDDASIPMSIVIGVIIGLLVPGNSDLSPNYRVVSSIIGWTYAAAWTISYYPQVFLNYTRKTSEGMAVDMVIYDLLGTTSLSIYSFAMYYNEDIKEQYRDKHNGNDSNVQINDVFFSIHAVVITIYLLAQMFWYDGWKQYPSKVCITFCTTLFFTGIIFLIIVVIADTTNGLFTMLNWLYFLSFVKLAVTLIKYIPQAVLNYERKSTKGYNITQMLLDLFGGVLSLFQLLLDANDMNEWNGVVGNIQKLILGILTSCFDMVYIVQHYILYPESGEDIEYNPLKSEVI